MRARVLISATRVLIIGTHALISGTWYFFVPCDDAGKSQLRFLQGVTSIRLMVSSSSSSPCTLRCVRHPQHARPRNVLGDETDEGGHVREGQGRSTVSCVERLPKRCQHRFHRGARMPQSIFHGPACVSIVTQTYIAHINALRRLDMVGAHQPLIAAKRVVCDVLV